jgi:hypothetical protein
MSTNHDNSNEAEFLDVIGTKVSSLLFTLTSTKRFCGKFTLFIIKLKPKYQLIIILAKIGRDRTFPIFNSSFGAESDR